MLRTLALLVLLAGQDDLKTLHDRATAALKAARTPEAATAAGVELLRVADAAWAANQYDTCGKAAGQAEQAARGAGAAALQAEAKRRQAEAKYAGAEYAKCAVALKTLADKPGDPDASGTWGLFLCFVKGDIAAGLPVLANASDPFLASVAELEKKGGATTADALAAAGAWWKGSADVDAKGLLTGATMKVKADKDFIARARTKMVERAVYWYGLAWPALTPAEREEVRARLKQAQANAKPTPYKPATPDGWGSMSGDFGRADLADVHARTGRYSLRFTPSKKTKSPWIVCDMKNVRFRPGRTYVFSVWYLTEKLEGGDHGFVTTANWSKGGAGNGSCLVVAHRDEPFWHKVTAEFTVPDGCDTFTMQFVMSAQAGQVFVDDVSIQDKNEPGRELVPNGSFE